ncbi:hypothetical protein OSTOST_24469, partial [Ostertagia ostertagi]
MSEDANARNRRAGTSKDGQEEEKSDEEKAPPKQDLYSPLCRAFENAPVTVTSTVSNAVKSGSGSGLYNNLQKYNLPDPQAVFDISFFHENPEPFYALCPRSFSPKIS